MKRLLIIFGVIIALGFIVPMVHFVYLEQTAFRRGEEQARAELAMGKVGYKFNGIPNANANQLFRLLKERGISYGVMDAGEMRTFKERNGYNSVMIPAIFEQYAIDVPAILRGEQGPGK
jgi:hypothetical protein